MSGFRIEGNTSGNVAEVDSDNQLKINLPTTASTSGIVNISAQDDDGAATGFKYIKEIYASPDFRLSSGLDTPLFDYQFTATAQDTGLWKCVYTTMTASQTGGFLLCNANSTATAAAGVVLQTWRHFKLMANAALYGMSICNLSAALLANQVIEFGFFVGTATTAPTDGAFFRITTAGVFGVITNGGTENAMLLPYTLPTPGVNHAYGINSSSRSVEFWIDDVLQANVLCPSGYGQPYQSLALPFSIQQRNSAGVGGGTQCQLKTAAIRIEQMDLALGMPLSHILSAAGQAYQGQSGGAQGTLATIVNNTAPTAAALQNTATLVAGLGGTAAVLPTLTANNDGIIFSYQNPAGGVSQTPRTLVITGVQIHGAVSTALSGGPVINALILNYGHTAVSLATAEGASFSTATTKIPRKVPVGFETYAANAAVGVLGTSVPIELDLAQSPVVVNPGEFVCISSRNIGTVTTTGAITYLCTIKHYWI
jgi:hypothetical protein